MVNLDVDRDGATLMALYQSDPSSKAIIDWFGRRANDAREIAVERAEQQTNLSRREVIRVFQTFEKMGFGEFKVGRRGSKTRLKFDVSILSIAKAATSAGQLIEKVAEASADERPVENRLPDQSNVTHRFQLRTDFEVTLNLPQDLSNKEADRLASFIKSLPFE